MELFRALGSLAEAPLPAHREVARALDLGEPPAQEEYADLLLFHLYPYASVYLEAGGMLGGEARDRIAGFWRALGLDPPGEADHLAVLLAMYARICELERAAASPRSRRSWRQARRALLWEHLLSWLPPWLGKLQEIAPPFYRRWGRLLSRALAEEAGSVGSPEIQPLHLRESPPLGDPRETGGEAFLRSLLAPVESGLILVRSDLARAARELGLGLRMGERSYVLKALSAQDPAGLWAWIGREASAWADRHRASWPAAEGIAAFWSGRAARTAELVAELLVDLEVRS